MQYTHRWMSITTSLSLGMRQTLPISSNLSTSSSGGIQNMNFEKDQHNLTNLLTPSIGLFHLQHLYYRLKLPTIN